MAAEALKVKSILNVIDARLIPDAGAKKARGEVFTPLELVREMLFGLRKSDLDRGINTIWGINEKGDFFDDNESNRVGGIPLEIWRDPETKWLDPANGIGNFPFIAYYMLDYQLDKHGKELNLKGSENKLKRRKHIVKNMLYMIEINKGNVNTSRKIFKQLVPSVDANIICADTEKLTENDLKKYFNIVNFDVIIGNPPFQDEDTSGGKNKLYERITVKYLKHLNKNGFLTFVTPDNIYSGNALNSYKNILNYCTIILNLRNISGIHFKEIGQSMCYFLLKNTNECEKTLIISKEIFVVKLKNRPINPVKEWSSKTEKIINNYVSNKENNAEYFRGTKESDFKGGEYKVIYTPDKVLRTNNLSLTKGFGKKKIVLFEAKPMSDGFVDNTGEFAVGPHTFFIPFETELQGEKLKNFFKSTEYKTIVKLSLTSQFLKTSLIKHLDIDHILSSSYSNTQRSQNRSSHHRTRKLRRFF
jgi:hypothetical protein